LTVPAVAAPPVATYWAKYLSVAAPLASATTFEFCEACAAPSVITLESVLSKPISTLVAVPDAFSNWPVVVSTVAPGSKYVETLPEFGVQLVRAILNGVRPAVAPAAASAEVDTVGSVTVKFLPPPLPLMVQVWLVIKPVKVMVPSAAYEAVGKEAAAVIAAAAKMPARVNFIKNPISNVWCE